MCECSPYRDGPYKYAGRLASVPWTPGNTYLYQPADRFWHFQFIEAGIFALLTAAALGATIWLLHRRAA